MNRQLLLLALLALTAQGATEELIDDFDGQYIPVEDITATAGRVSAKYVIGPMSDPSVVGEHAAYILGRLAKEYPDAKELVVACVDGKKTVYTYAAQASDVRQYALGDLSDAQMRERIKIEKGPDDTLLPWLLPAACAALAVALLIVLLLFRAGKRKRI